MTETEKVILQKPYQECIEIDGQKIKLPFTNSFCEIKLLRRNGKWYYLERQLKPSSRKLSWM